MIDKIKSLILGSGKNWPRREGTHEETFLDCRQFDGVDIVHDLNILPWPFEDSSFDEIAAIHLLEHLDSFLDFHNECWRVLKKGGALYVVTPDAGGPVDLCWADPTHKRLYRPASYINYMTIHEGPKFSYTDKFWAIMDLRVEDHCLKFHGTPLK